jgi:DNA-binding CsgD family transcriptional regulator
VTNPPPGLTQRQHDVWRLRKAGYGARRIARILHISRGTVQDHLDAIDRKLNPRPDDQEAA